MVCDLLKRGIGETWVWQVCRDIGTLASVGATAWRRGICSVVLTASSFYSEGSVTPANGRILGQLLWKPRGGLVPHTVPF